MKLHKHLALVLALQFAPVPGLAAEVLRVDGTSEETTSTTLQAIYAQHTRKDVCLLQAAIVNIAIGEKAKRDQANGGEETPPVPIGVYINGLTYKEILRRSKTYPQMVTPICRN